MPRARSWRKTCLAVRNRVQSARSIAHPDETRLKAFDTGGVRKLRRRLTGLGKRSGARVVYCYHNDTLPLFMLFSYAKSAAVDLTPDQKGRIAARVAKYLRTHWQRRRKP